MWFTRVSIDNPVFATMVMLAFVVLGLFSYQRLQVDQWPDVEIPVVVITTEYPGASPESIESEVSRKIEEAVNSINGIKVVGSRSFEGSSLVWVEFELSVDADQAAQDVRDKVAAVKVQFRKEVKEPKIQRFDPADRPILSLSVTGEGRSLRELTTLADHVIKRRLENVRGVGSVSLVGGVKRQVLVYLKPAQLEALAIGVDQVMNAVRGENQELPTGTIRSAERERVVRLEGRLKEVGDFNRIIVARRGGQPVYLEQVATVVDGEEEQESAALIDGRRTLAIDILKARGQNTIDVVNSIRAAAKALEPELPAGVRLEVVKDAAKPIRIGVDNTRQTMFEGALLTVAIVFLFLGSWRSTVITGLTLPIAILGTFLVLYWFGFTINMLTLMAMSLCIGLLIDDAIVVRENIVRHAALGADHRTAALEGTREIGLAVLATTLSIVAVFLPVGFMGGIIGRFFHQFGITVAAAVLLSMFISFTLDPMLSSVWSDPAVHGQLPRGPLGRLLRRFERLVGVISALYQRLLAWSLAHRGKTLAAALAIFVGSFFLMPLLGTEFVPQADFSETQVNFQTPVGSSLELTEAKARQVDAALREFPEVELTYTTINTANTGKYTAAMYVRLTERKHRKRSQFELTRPIRERLQQIAGITVTNVGTMNPVSNAKLLVLSLQGPDLAELEKVSEEAQALLRKIPGLVDLDSSQKPAKPTIAVEMRRELASDLGITLAQVGAALRPLLAGEDTGTWRGPDDEDYDVRVRLSPSDRAAAADLDRIMLTSSLSQTDGTPRAVPLRQVAALRDSLGVSQINRRDLSREVELTANVYGRSAGEVSRDIKTALDGMTWKPGYRWVMGGSTKDMQEAFGFAASALFLAIVFIYMILASQFRSFVQPLAIMSSLPLTLIGVILALMIFRSTLNLFSIIGFILLMGLVTKNAILLVDFANQARDAGSGREAALLEAARVRLRPILMTTLAMVFGMLPLALGIAEGAEQRAPMGQAVIGGVITSSLLTLVVVPVAYTCLDDLTHWASRRFRADGRKRK
ncbi:MAG TPA: efflux RND transporter permease subunit [Candidatus Desulfobacillus sp.]|nr:efflux RND transporter permease subunit [Candidatus Desulfobacillus sp.]